MEAIINVFSVFFAFSVIIFVRNLMYAKAPKKEELEERQAILDHIDKSKVEKYGISWKHDSMTEINRERGQKKSIVLFMSGLFIILLMGILNKNLELSMTNINFMSLSGMSILVYSIVMGND